MVKTRGIAVGGGGGRPTAVYKGEEITNKGSMLDKW